VDFPCSNLTAEQLENRHSLAPQGVWLAAFSDHGYPRGIGASSRAAQLVTD
jgi:hypothetical protein